jgi:hypothetical protein
MALNPFEQLEFFVPEPRQVFGEIVEMILRERFGPGVRGLGEADGRIEVVGPSPGSPQGRTLYQAAYFVRRWQSYQRKQLRDALQRALEAPSPPERWVLCVPTRLATEDLRWFESWRARQPIDLQVLDGNDWVGMLQEPSGRRALERICSWGVVLASGAEPHRVHGRLRVSAADPQSGLTHYLYVSLYHRGETAVKGLRVELAHSVTRCFSLRHDERQWRDEGDGNLNPRMLHACGPLLPKQERLVAVVPISAQTPLPVGLRLRFSTEATARVEQHLRVDERVLVPVDRLDFAAGAGPRLVLVAEERVPVAAA